MVRTVDFQFLITRNGANYCELHPTTESAPTIQNDTSNSVHASFSGSFLPPEKAVDWLTDEIRPRILIDGVAHNLGVFLPYSIQEADDGVSKSISISAYDRGWLARDHKTERTIYFQAGTNYVEAVVSLLAEAGIVMINETGTDQVLTEDREDWDIGTSYLDIVNDLLGEINYAPLWFDADGIAVVAPVKTPTAINIEHTLDEKKIESLMLPGLRSTTDTLNTPNVFVCVCSNADKSAPMRAVAENTNPQSPLSIARRGRRITKVIQVNNIASQEALQAYANRQVTDSMLAGETITVNTCLLPGFGASDITALHYGDIMAICKETAWTMNLTIGGTMSHTLERVVMNLD